MLAGDLAARAALYRTCPAVGPITAATLAVELGDLTRFEKPEQATSYTGLCPSDFSSGGADRKGSITKEGNRRARTILVQAAWRLIKKDAGMRAFYDRIAKRRGSKRAIVAVARKMLHAFWAMSKTGEAWRTSN